MIPKSDCVHGHWYRGGGRNFELAQWNAETQMFTGTREKFGTFFPELACHREDSLRGGFNPTEDCGPVKPHEHKWRFSDKPHGNSKWHEYCESCRDIRDADGYHKVPEPEPAPKDECSPGIPHEWVEVPNEEPAHDVCISCGAQRD